MLKVVLAYNSSIFNRTAFQSDNAIFQKRWITHVFLSTLNYEMMVDEGFCKICIEYLTPCNYGRSTFDLTIIPYTRLSMFKLYSQGLLPNVPNICNVIRQIKISFTPNILLKTYPDISSFIVVNSCPWKYRCNHKNWLNVQTLEI